MIEFSANESGESGSLTLSGEVTIQHAEILKEALLEAISVSKRLEFNLEKIERTDLSCLQLLCSAHRSFLHAGKEVKAVGKIPPSFRDAVLEAGFVGCVAGDDSSGLWTGA